MDSTLPPPGQVAKEPVQVGLMKRRNARKYSIANNVQSLCNCKVILELILKSLGLWETWDFESFTGQMVYVGKNIFLLLFYHLKKLEKSSHCTVLFVS